jgi:hypothetical protein
MSTREICIFVCGVMSSNEDLNSQSIDAPKRSNSERNKKPEAPPKPGHLFAHKTFLMHSESSVLAGERLTLTLILDKANVSISSVDINITNAKESEASINPVSDQEFETSTNTLSNFKENADSIKPATTMYWSCPNTYGVHVPPLRAHASVVAGGKIYVFGGSGSELCYKDMYIFDTRKNKMKIL